MGCETENVQKLNPVFLRLRLFPESDKKLFPLFVIFMFIVNIRALSVMHDVSHWRWVEKTYLFP